MKNMNMKYNDEYKSGNNIKPINNNYMYTTNQNVFGVNQVVISDGVALPKSAQHIYQVMDSQKLFPFLMQFDNKVSEVIKDNKAWRPAGVVHIYDPSWKYGFSLVCFTLQKRCKVASNKKGAKNGGRYKWVEVPSDYYRVIGTFFTAEMRDALSANGLKWQGIHCPKTTYEICQSHNSKFDAQIAIMEKGLFVSINQAVVLLRR